MSIIVYFFLGATFLAAGFLAAFLAAGFLAAAFFGFLAFLAAGFFAFLTFLTFLALGFFAFLTFFGLTTLTTPRLRARRTWTAALAASTLLLATMYLRIAWREEPVRDLRAVMAVAIITEYLGWAAGALGAFLTLGAAAVSDIVVCCL